MGNFAGSQARGGALGGAGRRSAGARCKFLRRRVKFENRHFRDLLIFVISEPRWSENNSIDTLVLGGTA